MQQQTLFNFGQKKNQNEMDLEIQQQKQTKQSNLIPWVEKYRPNTLDEISFQTEITNMFKGVLQTGNLPHTLLYGPAGTGKTSSILALAKQLFGKDFYLKRVLELNASDERGIAVVREKIKKFASQMASKNPDKSVLCPGYKIIILDEADLMTTDAQSALRRIIEDFSQTTRFCIICNYITKIIEPITSRCIKCRFQQIPIESQIEKLKYICRKEEITYDDMALFKLINASGGDLRKSINLLQSASQLFDKVINESNVIEVLGQIPDELISQIFEIINTKDLQKVKSYVEDILLEGYASDQIISQFFDQILYNSPTINELKKARIIEKIAYCDKNLNEGANDELQLLNLFSSIVSIIDKPDY